MEGMIFCCPLCGEPLVREEHRAVCSQRHSFDVARQGYVHLLPVNKMHSKLPGDSRGNGGQPPPLFGGGLLRPPFGRSCAALSGSAPRTWAAGRERVSPSATPAAGRGITQRDFGGLCPRRLSAGLTFPSWRSRPPRENTRESSLGVASSFAIPLGTGRVHLLTDVFSPLAPEEFARVVRPGGYFLYAVPGERHLYGLKEILYRNPYENPPPGTQSTRGFRFSGAQGRAGGDFHPQRGDGQGPVRHDALLLENPGGRRPAPGGDPRVFHRDRL